MKLIIQLLLVTFIGTISKDNFGQNKALVWGPERTIGLSAPDHEKFIKLNEDQLLYLINIDKKTSLSLLSAHDLTEQSTLDIDEIVLGKVKSRFEDIFKLNGELVIISSVLKKDRKSIYISSLSETLEISNTKLIGEAYGTGKAPEHKLKTSIYKGNKEAPDRLLIYNLHSYKKVRGKRFEGVITAGISSESQTIDFTITTVALPMQKVKTYGRYIDTFLDRSGNIFTIYRGDVGTELLNTTSRFDRYAVFKYDIEQDSVSFRELDYSSDHAKGIQWKINNNNELILLSALSSLRTNEAQDSTQSFNGKWGIHKIDCRSFDINMKKEIFFNENVRDIKLRDLYITENNELRVVGEYSFRKFNGLTYERTGSVIPGKYYDYYNYSISVFALNNSGDFLWTKHIAKPTMFSDSPNAKSVNFRGFKSMMNAEGNMSFVYLSDESHLTSTPFTYELRTQGLSKELKLNLFTLDNNGHEITNKNIQVATPDNRIVWPRKKPFGVLDNQTMIVIGSSNTGRKKYHLGIVKTAPYPDEN